MLKPVYQNQFNKDIKKSAKRGKDINKLKAVILLLLKEKPLSVSSRNHKLRGGYTGCWECHIEPDWLLIYQKTNTELRLIRTGTHSDLFR